MKVYCVKCCSLWKIKKAAAQASIFKKPFLDHDLKPTCWSSFFTVCRTVFPVSQEHPQETLLLHSEKPLSFYLMLSFTVKQNGN